MGYVTATHETSVNYFVQKSFGIVYLEDLRIETYRFDHSFDLLVQSSLVQLNRFDKMKWKQKSK